MALRWHADLGGGLRPIDLAEHFHDLHQVITVGERWGLELARAAARQRLISRLVRGGPGVVFEDMARRLGYGRSDINALEEWLHTGWYPGPRKRFFRDPSELLGTLADVEAEPSLGVPLTMTHVDYRNPIQVEFSGAGYVVLGVILALRIVRDWSTRRRGNAADARMRESRADLYDWLIRETMEGRTPVPPGDLLQLALPLEVDAMDRLADKSVELQLPEGTEPP